MPFGFLFPKQNSLKNGKKSSFQINICSFSLAWNPQNKVAWKKSKNALHSCVWSWVTWSLVNSSHWSMVILSLCMGGTYQNLNRARFEYWYLSTLTLTWFDTFTKAAIQNIIQSYLQSSQYKRQLCLRIQVICECSNLKYAANSWFMKIEGLAWNSGQWNYGIARTDRFAESVFYSYGVYCCLLLCIIATVYFCHSVL